MAEPMSEEHPSSWTDNAPITDTQIKTLRRDLDAIGSARARQFAPFVVRKLMVEVERLRAHLAAEHLATEAAETENDRLRKQVAEIGETAVEWRAEQPSGAWNMSHALPHETVARAVVEVTRKMGHTVTLQQRLAGQWRNVTEEADRG